MTQHQGSSEKLRQFIDDFFEGKQNRFADEYGFSPSQVSTWLNPKVMKPDEKPKVPTHVEKIIDLHRETTKLSVELEAMRVGRVLAMKTGFAIVHFPDEAEPGSILCRGIPDLETANRVLTALRAAEAPHTPKES